MYTPLLKFTIDNITSWKYYSMVIACSYETVKTQKDIFRTLVCLVFERRDLIIGKISYL